MYGFFCEINSCCKIPIDTKRLYVYLEQLSLRGNIKNICYYRVLPKEFNRVDVENDFYKSYSTNILNANEFFNNTFYNAEILFFNGVEAKIQIDLYDDISYCVSLYFSLEQLEELHMHEKDIFFWVKDIAINQFDILSPVYGGIDVENGVLSLSNNNQVLYPFTYLSLRIYDKLKVPHQFMIKNSQGFQRLKNGVSFLLFKKQEFFYYELQKDIQVNLQHIN